MKQPFKRRALKTLLTILFTIIGIVPMLLYWTFCKITGYKGPAKNA